MQLLNRFRSHPSLRFRLLVLMGAVLIVLLVASGTAILAFISGTDRANWQARQQDVAQSAAESVSTFVLQIVNFLDAVALLDRESLAQNPEWLQPFLEQNSALLELIRLRPGGELVANVAQNTKLLDDPFITVQANWFRATQAGENYFGDVQIGADGEPYLIVAVPTANQGTVAARLKLDVLWEVIAQVHVGESGNAYVINRSGRIIAHRDPEVVLAYTELDPASSLAQAVAAGQELSDAPYINFRGERVLGVTRTIPGTPWVVVTELRTTEVFARFRVSLVVFVLGTLSILALAMRAITYLLDRNVLWPLQHLQASAKHVGQGDFSHPVPIMRMDEIGAVAGAFNEMIYQLDSRERALAAQALALADEVEEHRRTEKALSISEARNRAIIEALPDLLLQIERDGTILELRSGRDWQDLPWPTDVVGQRLDSVLPANLIKLASDAIDQVLTSRDTHTIEFEAPANGSVHNYEARLAFTGDHELLGIVRDITERKQRETLLQLALENERKLGELKSRFMTLMSHEFRTPLAIILTTAELLERAGDAMAPERRSHHFGGVRTQVHHLTRILDDILLISRAETVGLELNRQWVDVVELCRATIDEITPLLNGQEVLFHEHNGQQRVLLDIKLIRQALTNLLSNASKYSAPGSKIQVLLEIAQQKLKIQVIDSGIGIAEEDQKHLFTVFHRGRNTDYRPGIGLGLTIVKHAVELHDGTIQCESQLNVGTTFTICIPLEPVNDAMPLGQTTLLL